MSAGQDQEAEERCRIARDAQELLRAVEREHHRARLRYITAARAAGWSWKRIGAAIGFTEAWGRGHFARHRQEAGRLG